MNSTEWILIGISVGLFVLFFVGLALYSLYRRVLHPRKYDKIVILNQSCEDDVFFVKKKGGYKIDKDMRKITLYASKNDPDGELYVLPLLNGDDDNVQNRIRRFDERGHHTYHFYRNNPNPVVFEPSPGSKLPYKKQYTGALRIVEDGQLLAKVQDTNLVAELFKTLDEKNPLVLYLAIIIGLLVVAMLVLFAMKDQTICKSSIKLAVQAFNSTVVRMPVVPMG